MLRSRSIRNTRNPNNLHVIPISCVVNDTVVPPIVIPPTTQFIQPSAQFIPPAMQSIPSARNFFDRGNMNNNYLNKYSKKRKKRQRKRDRKRFLNKTANSNYAWVNPNINKENNNVVNAPKEKVTDSAKVPEVPTSTDEDFEEVEVASSEGEGKKIPVGFRQTKPMYLNYKKKSFFKPKFFNFSSQRTVVNCLNVEDDDSVDVDVVSEAEYDEYETDAYDAVEKFGTIIEIEEDEATEDGGEETAHEAEEKEESTNIVTDGTEDSTQAISCEITSGDVNEVDKKSIAEEVNKKCSTVTVDLNEKSNDIEMTSEVKDEKKPDNDKVFKTWISKPCIKGTDDLIQGKSVIQDKLDVWESHLIGLEYLLEICDKSKVSVLKYYCVLCDEELDVQELPESYVINHVSGFNHVTKYLEKHFPSSDFNLNEKSSYDFVMFQKLCEKINEDSGYQFMCITNNDYYSENKLKIKEIIESASHSDEKDLNLEKTEFEKKVNVELSENISCIIKDLISKIIPENEITTESKKDAKGSKSCSEDKMTDLNKKPPVSKPRPKHKQNNSISAFLRLKFAASNKLGSDKEKSNKGKNKKEKSNSEQTVESVKSSDEKSKEKLHDEVSKEKLNDEKSKEQQVTGSSNDHVTKDIKSSTTQKSPLTKNTIKKIQPKENNVIETITLDDEEEESINLKNDNQLDQTETDEPQSLEKSADNSAVIESDIPKVKKDIATKKIVKNKDKVIVKTTIHSKHCPKRILDSGIARLKLAAKTPTKSRLVTELSNKSNVKCKSVTEKVISDAPKKVITKKIKPELKENKLAITSTHKAKPSYKVIPVQQTSATASKSSVTGHSIVHQKTIQKKAVENSSKNEVDTADNDTSHWIPMRSTSPVITSDINLFLKKIAGPPQSPVKKTRYSPVRKITSPLKLGTKTHSRRYSKSPTRRKSRSPYRKLSKSPLRRSRSPVRRRSRSPIRHRSRSPVRRHSRSPRRRSRSPRRRSRSPRRRSRSPLRRYSRSPFRRLSRSPLSRHSRSPIKHRSRSPQRRHSRSPLKRRSRSPYRRQSRSPYRRQSRSPVQAYSSAVNPRLIASKYKNLREIDIGHSSSSRQYYSPDERFRNNAATFPKRSDYHESEIVRSRDGTKMFHSSRINKSDRYKSQAMSSASARGISDLDPVSDEDESIYFDKHLLSEDSNVSSSNKAMLSKLMQKFSTADNPSDPALNNLLQFMETHKTELEEFIALKSASKSEKINAMKFDSNFQQQTLFLQQFLLANLASSIQESGPSVSNVQYTPSQLPFLQENASLRFGHPSINMPGPTNIPPVPQPAPMQPRFFPPNVNVPPPQLFPSNTQPMQNFAPKPKPTTEVIFKDLKATVSKLFGANESGIKQDSKPQIPNFMSTQLPDPEKWDLNHPSAPKFNVSSSPKNVFPPSGKNVNFSGIQESPIMKEQISSNNTPEQFLSGSSNDRSRIPSVPVPPPDAKVTFCDTPRNSSKGNLFPVVNPNPSFNAPTARGGVNDVKVSLAQRLASVLVKIGMVDVPAPLLQEMLMKIGAFSSSPRQDISENEILSILKRLGYLS